MCQIAQSSLCPCCLGLWGWSPEEASLALMLTWLRIIAELASQRHMSATEDQLHATMLSRTLESKDGNKCQHNLKAGSNNSRQDSVVESCWFWDGGVVPPEKSDRNIFSFRIAKSLTRCLHITSRLFAGHHLHHLAKPSKRNCKNLIILLSPRAIGNLSYRGSIIFHDQATLSQLTQKFLVRTLGGHGAVGVALRLLWKLVFTPSLSQAMNLSG